MDLTGPRILSGIVPSVVSVTNTGSVIAGNDARELLLTQPESTVYSVKRLMGRGIADVQDELKLFPFRLEPGSDAVLAPAAVPTHHDAARSFGAHSSQAQERRGSRAGRYARDARPCSTVPAYFNDAQRHEPRKTRNRIAGLEVLRPVKMSRRRPRSPMAWTPKPATKGSSRFTISAAARSISPSCGCMRASSKSSLRTATRTWVATTSIIC